MGHVGIDLLGVPRYVVGIGVPAAAVDLIRNEHLLILDAVPVVPVKRGFFRGQHGFAGDKLLCIPCRHGIG